MSSSDRPPRFPALPDAGRCSGVAHAARQRGETSLTAPEHARFEALYREHFDFVFRNLRRLGVTEASIDDALQDVYMTALRRIADYRNDTHPKAWLFAMTMRVASNYRRGERRRGEPLALDDHPIATSLASPFALTAQVEARRLLHAFLESLDESRRAVFVMTELEQMTAPEIARALTENLNTVYSRLRSARAEFVRWLGVSDEVTITRRR